MTADLFNGCFEAAGAVFLWLNILAILRDGELKGVHWGPTVFFTAWSTFNLWFYPHQGLWFSFLGGCAIAISNTIWLYLVWKYRGLRR